MAMSVPGEIAEVKPASDLRSPVFGKRKVYRDVAFKPAIVESAFTRFQDKIARHGLSMRKTTCTYWDGDGRTSIENATFAHREECFSSESYLFYAYTTKDPFIGITYDGDDLTIEAKEWPKLSDAKEILEVFEAAYQSSKRPVDEKLKRIQVFIGHGRSPLWRDLKDHLTDKHGVKVTAYETGARAGYSIQEVLADMSDKATLALLVLTGEDAASDGQTHARENVVHETGLFQGRLGFKRAIVLLEDGTSEFSNIAGMQQIRFQKGNIKETFGEVLAILWREFSNGAA